MSIRDEINNRVAEGRLFHLPPAIVSSAVSRTLFVGESLNGIINPPAEHRYARLRADLDAFTEGRLITIAENPYKKPNSAYMARTCPKADEVWDIRSRDPKPAMRVLGCFAEQDLFIALVYEFRVNLGGPRSKEWRDFIERCKAEWRKLFPSYPPLKGETLHDYIKRDFISV